MANSTDFNGNGTTHVRTTEERRRATAAPASTRAEVARRRRTPAPTGTTQGGEGLARRPRRAPLHGARHRSAGRRRLRAPVEHHHQPRRQHRLQDGGRRGPRELEPARDRHPHLQVLPQGGPPRRQGQGRDERPPGRPSPRAHDPPRGGRLRRLLRHEGRRRHVRGRALAPARQPVRRVQLAGLVQPAASGTSTGSSGSGGNWAWDAEADDGHARRRTPTSARSARRASSRR